MPEGQHEASAHRRQLSLPQNLLTFCQQTDVRPFSNLIVGRRADLLWALTYHVATEPCSQPHRCQAACTHRPGNRKPQFRFSSNCKAETDTHHGKNSEGGYIPRGAGTPEHLLQQLLCHSACSCSSSATDMPRYQSGNLWRCRATILLQQALNATPPTAAPTIDPPDHVLKNQVPLGKRVQVSSEAVERVVVERMVVERVVVVAVFCVLTRRWSLWR